jgi:hypothetical protein
MSLTVDGLKAAIKSAQEAAYGPPADSEEEDKAAGVLAEAIVNYIQANLTITVTGTVTSGAGSGGAVTGTGTPI